MELKEIAVIHTDFPEKFGIPRQSGLVGGLQGTIVFSPEYRNADAIRGLNDFSHLWLVWGFSKAKKDHWSATVRPPRLGGKVRMGIFALISEVPFDLAFYHRLVYTEHQNVFFTLGLGLLAIWFLEHPIEQLDIPDVLYKLLVIIAAGLIAEFFNTDYGFTGIAVICIFYYLRGQPQLKYPIAAILLAAMGGVEVYAVLALIPILLYNGQRGRQTKVMQYGFYIFYPAHLLLIAALYHLFIL